MISFTDDADKLPDSDGEYTKASLNKLDMPRDFTICGAFMTPAARSGYFYHLYSNGREWSLVGFNSKIFSTQYTVTIGRVRFAAYSAKVPVNMPAKNLLYFVTTWTHMCLSLDTSSGMIKLVVNGEVLYQRVNRMALKEDKTRPANLEMFLGYNVLWGERSGMVNKLNIFSSPLPTARMVALTQAGGEECGAAGDYVSWEEEDWKLHSKATMKMVEEFDGACRKESEVNVFASGGSHSYCMQHCQKIGGGRSPPVRTLEEWDWLRKELHAITRVRKVLPMIWMAATDTEVEGQWKDYYTGQKLNASLAWPWFPCQDTKFGTRYNCLSSNTNVPDDRYWYEKSCLGSSNVCPCQYTKQPLIHLRGYNCKKSYLLKSRIGWFTPKQLAPQDVFLLGQFNSEIRYNLTSKLWVLTQTTSNVTAVTKADKKSHALGKYEWTVTDDNPECEEGKPYKILFKLTGCDEKSEFTCNNGQCISLVQRCDQMPNCRDKSDEKGCQLMELEDGYNKNIPPITSVSETDFTVVPVPVDISINLLKIVSMEEVQHKIDFKFEIILEWTEPRIQYFYNLKDKTSLNALTDDDIQRIWLPYVIYDNTDMQEAVRLEEGVVDTTIVVKKEQKTATYFTADDLDEAWGYKGSANKLIMSQTYTKSFQCLYHLQKYPFDTQV